MKTLLLTGATGFVGRNVILRELDLGTRIFAPVREPEKLRLQLAREGLSKDAVTPLSPDPRSWGRIEPTHALLSAGVLFARNREEYFKTNVDWTLEILRALPETCRTVVLSSQSAGGPTPTGQPSRSESDSDAPLTWYGESKLELEQAIRRFFPTRKITILRPPMILGARDSATLPLFKMGRNFIRTKPGLRKKEFSFIAIEDLVDAISAAFELEASGPFYISSDQTISDFDLIDTAAQAVGGRGVTLPVPLSLVKMASLLVDSIPTLRKLTPSLTRDRAKEIWPDRWVVDSNAFRTATGWRSRHNLSHALHSACEFFSKEGLLAHRHSA
jgi:nucleoside-diphosphate-sugar epimerase